MKPGPVTADQLRRLADNWKQGEHILITGNTGSGKTTIARYIDQIRIDNGGYVVAFIMKHNADRTITQDFKGWTRWKTWKKGAPAVHENRVLLWPDVRKLTGKDEILAHQRSVFQEAIDSINKMGRWTIHVDEGLYMCSPRFLNLGGELEMGHAIGRSNDLTYITLAQRPANIPLILYGSATHAIMGQTRELEDLKRLRELGGRESAVELGKRLSDLQGHDFLWVPTRDGMSPEVMNLKN